MQLILFELVGAVLLIVAIGLFWVARPVDGQPALFLRKKQRYEVVYTLIILFTLTGGLGGMLLGLTT